MAYLLLSAAVLFAAGQNVAKKAYQSKTESSPVFVFSLIATLVAMLLFVMISRFRLNFSVELLPYAVGFALSYACALLGSVLAMKYGSMAIALLASSYSLVIPTLHGVLVIGERMGVPAIVGLMLLLASLFLIRKPALNGKKDWRFFLCLLLSFGGNGFCSVVQKMQQTAFAGAYKSEFMILSLAFCAIFLLAGIAVKGEGALPCKRELVFGALCGISNGMMNYLVMVLTGLLPTVVLYPSISAGGVVLGFAIAILGYGERLSKRQYIGYAMGLISILLLQVF